MFNKSFIRHLNRDSFVYLALKHDDLVWYTFDYYMMMEFYFITTTSCIYKLLRHATKAIIATENLIELVIILVLIVGLKVDDYLFVE